jgi:hypothetical protein
MKAEYSEGMEIAEKFEKAMKLLFQTPKPEVEKKAPKAATPRKRRKLKD